MIGETAPLLITVGIINGTNLDPFDGRMATLPVFAYYQLTQPGVPAGVRDRPGLDGGPRPHHPGHGAQRRRPPDQPLLRPQDRSLTGPTWRNPWPSASTSPTSTSTTATSWPSQGVTVSIEPRSITALIGPSGCGKSTFLRSLNRMHEVIPGARVEGKVVIDGQDLYGADVDPVDVRRQIGMVFQRPNPFPTMSIYDNVAAGLRLNAKKMKKADLDDLVERSLRGANLWTEVKDRLDRPGSGLSGGQQQRLCIARAIAVEPEVLLMDEPCSALDPISTLAIEDLMTELKERFTIVIVTHNMQQAARVSESTGFFNLSRRRPAGPPDRVQPDREDLQQPRREGDRGLHLRPLRLSQQLTGAARCGCRRPPRRRPAGAAVGAAGAPMVTGTTVE